MWIANNEVDIERIPDYKPSADKVLGDDVEFHLESDDPDNYVYDDDGDGGVRSRKPDHSVN